MEQQRLVPTMQKLRRQRRTTIWLWRIVIVVTLAAALVWVWSLHVRMTMLEDSRRQGDLPYFWKD